MLGITTRGGLQSNDVWNAANGGILLCFFELSFSCLRCSCWLMGPAVLPRCTIRIFVSYGGKVKGWLEKSIECFPYLEGKDRVECDVTSLGGVRCYILDGIFVLLCAVWTLIGAGWHNEWQRGNFSLVLIYWWCYFCDLCNNRSAAHVCSAGCCWYSLFMRS